MRVEIGEGFRLGRGLVGDGGPEVGLEGAELGEGLAEGLLGGVAEAVDAGDGGLGDEGVAGPGGAHLVGSELVLGGVPGFGFEPAVSAEHPFEVGEGVDEGALGGGGGAVFGGELGFEGLELGGALVPDDDAGAVEAGFEGVAAGDGLALGGARAGAFLCVQAVGLDLLVGRHKVERGGPGWIRPLRR